MSWLITGTQKTLNGTLTVGQELQGGYFAGYISHTADGNPTHALIVAPAATGATGTGYPISTNSKWADETVALPANNVLIGANSVFDGKANTDLMMGLIAAGTYSVGAFPAASFCAGLSIGGFNDWYFPSRFEADIAYFNLKPTADPNSTGWGVNLYSVPARNSNYTVNVPSQTAITSFQSGQAQAFANNTHWISTENASNTAWDLQFTSGGQSNGGAKQGQSRRVRAFRRITL